MQKLLLSKVFKALAQQDSEHQLQSLT